jgi:hypothetical protein
MNLTKKQQFIFVFFIISVLISCLGVLIIYCSKERTMSKRYNLIPKPTDEDIEEINNDYRNYLNGDNIDNQNDVNIENVDSDSFNSSNSLIV